MYFLQIHSSSIGNPKRANSTIALTESDSNIISFVCVKSTCMFGFSQPTCGSCVSRGGKGISSLLSRLTRAWFSSLCHCTSCWIRIVTACRIRKNNSLLPWRVINEKGFSMLLYVDAYKYSLLINSKSAKVERGQKMLLVVALLHKAAIVSLKVVWHLEWTHLAGLCVIQCSLGFWSSTGMIHFAVNS